MHLAAAFLVAAALAASPQDPPARDPGTWILMIEGDANGLAVTRAAAKPFAYREPRIESEWRVVLLDKNGKEIAAPPLDFSPFCMEHAHVGQGPHVTGDYSREHRVVFTVKVPARADVAQIRIEHRVAGRTPEVLGRIDRNALIDLVRKSEEKRK